MWGTDIAKNVLEWIHLSHLENMYNLAATPYSPEFRTIPDLTAPQINAFFELKSRNRPMRGLKGTANRRPRSDYRWWSVDSAQISGHERRARAENKQLFWIFMLSETRESPTNTPTLNYRHIRSRESWVLPWEIHERVSVSGSRYKHIGYNTFSNDKFVAGPSTPRSKIHIEASIVNIVAPAFSL